MKAAGFEVLPYAQAADYLAGVKGALLIDPNKTAVGTLRRLPEDVRLIEAIHPSTFFKSVKSDADITHIRNTMAEDGAALCGFFAEFEQILADGGELSELDIDGMLYKHRSQRPGFISLKFRHHRRLQCQCRLASLQRDTGKQQQNQRRRYAAD